MLKTNSSTTVDQSRRLENKTRDTINGLMRKAAVSEENKPIVFAGALLALTHKPFKNTYSILETKTLGESAFNAIKEHLKTSHLITDEGKLNKFTQPLQVLKNHNQLHAYTTDEETTTYFKEILDQIIQADILSSTNPDILADYYTEFLKYSGGDGKGLGIILTPAHITNLFSHLGVINNETIVVDTCFGTGSFISSALHRILELTPEDKKTTVLQNNVVGIELNPKMFTLGATNLLLQNVNIDNLHEGSCFDKTIINRIQNSANRPTLALINPPYSLKKNGGKAEIEFIENACELVTPGGYVMALVPTSTGADTSTFSKQIKTRILKNHSLHAVISLPTDLFAGKAGTITQILVFKTGAPHSQKQFTWVANWTEDGFFVKKHVGRDDFNNTWETYKETWISSYVARKEQPGFAALVKLTENDEWVTEAYLATDHTQIKQLDFETKLLNFAQHELKRSAPNTPTLLNTTTWEDFKITDLFTIKRGNYKQSSEKRTPGETPLVSASQFSNGVTDYIKLQPGEGTLFPAGTLSVSKNGSVGECFYQPEQYVATSDMAVLIPKKEYSKSVLLFIATVIAHQTTNRFNYGFKLNTQRLNNLSIPLPANKGEVNVEMMEMMIKEMNWMVTND